MPANRFELFTPDTNPAVRLVNMINPYVKNKNHTSSTALALIDTIEPEQLNTSCDLVTEMAYVKCELEKSVPHTLGTQCLVYLYDPGNGWIWDYTKRGDMLLMTAKLIEKGAILEGLYYYRDHPVILDQSFKQIVQSLINRRLDDPPAELNGEVIEIFTKAGYDFSYPSETCTKNEIRTKPQASESTKSTPQEIARSYRQTVKQDRNALENDEISPSEKPDRSTDVGI